MGNKWILDGNKIQCDERVLCKCHATEAYMSSFSLIQTVQMGSDYGFQKSGWSFRGTAMHIERDVSVVLRHCEKVIK